MRYRDSSADKRIPTFKRIINLCAGSFACVHLLACIWHYLGQNNADWQQDGLRVSWLNVDQDIAGMTFERNLWGMDGDASAWGRCDFVFVCVICVIMWSEKSVGYGW